MTPRSTAIRVALVLGVALVAAGPALRSPWVSGVVAGDRMGSGTVARRFVAALAAGDLDGAMALIAPDAEVLTPDGTTLAGADDVRAYLATVPLPMTLVAVLPWGGSIVEAHVEAGGTALVFIFSGGGGTIVAIQVAPDDGSVVPLPTPTPTAPR